MKAIVDRRRKTTMERKNAEFISLRKKKPQRLPSMEIPTLN